MFLFFSRAYFWISVYSYVQSIHCPTWCIHFTEVLRYDNNGCKICLQIVVLSILASCQLVTMRIQLVKVPTSQCEESYVKSINLRIKSLPLSQPNIRMHPNMNHFVVITVSHSLVDAFCLHIQQISYIFASIHSTYTFNI